MNGLLVCAGEGQQKNIGDYIQSVAQEQFYDHIDRYVEREHLDKVDEQESVKVIMNAWFMWHPENFPPSPMVDPLFLSFHIVPDIAERLLTPQVIEYLKQYEPIGARDTNTKKILESYGIKSYFSGCLTLTLGLKYKSNVHNDTILFVDPYYELGGRAGLKGIKKVLLASWLLLKHFHKVMRLRKRFVAEFYSRLSRISVTLDRYLHCASFYDAYSQCFTDDVILNAEYIAHTVDQSLFKGNDDKMEYARELLKKYARAGLVVTSRIHCGLPCLGIETPVIFVSSEKLEGNSVRSGGRFGGLIELFYTMRFTSSGVQFNDKSFSDLIATKKISRKTSFKNKDDYKPLCNEMIRIVNVFVSKT